MTGTVSAILLASFLGSVHCAGMCGAFVCFYTGTAHGTAASALRAHALYNVGRLTSYCTLGALAGGVGAGVAALGVRSGMQHAAAAVAGLLMVAWATNTIMAQRGVRWRRSTSHTGHRSTARAPEWWTRAMGHLLHAVREQPMAIRAWLTGLVTTLLPCGWLYAFVATAGGAGSVRGGMLVMAAFWLGTVPALVTVGLGAQRLFAPLRVRLPMLSPAIVLVMGLLTISGRFAPHHAGSTPAGATASAAPNAHAHGGAHP